MKREKLPIEYKNKLRKYPMFLGWIEFSELELATSPRLNKEAEYDLWHKERIIRELINNNHVICGDTHQWNAIPVFTDGYVLLSMRVWADLMEEVYKIRHPQATPSDYGSFYMAAVCKVPEDCPAPGYIQCEEIE